MEHLPNHEDSPSQQENSHKFCDEKRHPVLGFDGKSMETVTTTLLEFLNERKAIVEQILASEEINQSKRAGLFESQSGTRVRKLTI